METKAFWKSKTLWVNFLAFVALAVQTATGFAFSPEYQVGALAAVNFLLRLVTKSGLE